MRDRRSASLPVDLMVDPKLIPADLVVALAVVAAVPLGEAGVSTGDPRLLQICKFKRRAINESLVRLQDAGWVSAHGLPKTSARMITPLWIFQDEGEEGGES